MNCHAHPTPCTRCLPFISRPVSWRLPTSPDGPPIVAPRRQHTRKNMFLSLIRCH
ncbi:hypothetical protein BAUCODRAFT_510292 [Baudoinia panamericana UAMH 10762]|uniref:Uncharacterized protein n=1 Tax=Baudoinia panamericana (strain UAMH 10762) TaxID=717646 RepID=M2N9Z0_BAUPA|nr:uncharacterized protein BAUCODRAFT_510292 [Baudoinia panamericana UAMH 10762]EMC95954.1 hypothetical protein BAUCODRAFT_510292 [Baudoinia panamericana UAMH 10762]